MQFKHLRTMAISLAPKHTFFFIVVFWNTPGHAQVLFLILRSEITPRMLRGPYVMLRIEPGSTICKANALAAVLYSSSPFFRILDLNG